MVDAWVHIIYKRKNNGWKTMMEKVFYQSNIAWSWIKQRPQFMAESLQQFYDVNVFVKKEYKKETVRCNNTDIFIQEMFRLPFNRFCFIRKINELLLCKELNKNIYGYDIVYFTDSSYIKENIKKINDQIWVYDCMDDIAEFPNVKENKRLRDQLIEREGSLIKKCDLVSFTSKFLMYKVLERNKLTYNDKYVVINNAVSDDLIKENYIISEEKINHKLDNNINVTYIGTISEWFDFDLLINCLNKYDNVSFNLYGPTDVKIPKHANIIWHGPIEYKQIKTVMSLADALMMPFKLNELVKAVNPVKLYEYIMMNKPVISIGYDETEKFGEYIYRYYSQEEFNSLIFKLLNKKLFVKKKHSEITNFILDNTWKQRAKMIKRFIDKIK